MNVLAMVLALVPTVASTPQDDEAFPLFAAAHPLRRLYRKADLVVVGKPGETVTVAKDDLDRTYRTTLAVTQVAKGKAADPREIAIQTHKLGYCGVGPGANPSAYPKGKTLLTFLRWDPAAKAYSPVANPYASLVLDDPTLAACLKQLQELDAILEEKPGDPPGAATVDWVVRCIENPLTRAEGVKELAVGEQAPFIEGEPRKDWVPVEALTEPQRKRIVDALVSPHVLQEADCSLFYLVWSSPDPRINPYVIGELRRMVDAKSIRWGTTIIHFLSQRLKLDAGELLRDFHVLGAQDKEVQVRLAKSFLEQAATK